MNKVLLALPYNINDQASYESIVTKFEENGYIVYVFNDINDETLSLDLLPEILKHVITELNIGMNNSIAILSNIPVIILAWSRIFDDLIDDFILFIDNTSLDSGIELFSAILNFKSDINQKKIYINLNFNTYQSVSHLLINHNNFKYFNIIDRFNFNDHYTTKEFKETNEILNNLTNIIYLKAHTSQSNQNPVIQLNNEMYELLNENDYFIFFMLKKLYQHAEVATQFVLGYFFHLRSQHSLKKQIFEDLLNYFKLLRFFPEKLYFLSLLVVLGIENESLTKEIVQILLDDESYINYHYSMFYNLLFYVNRDNLKTYEGYMIHRREILNKIAKYYELDLYRNSSRNINSTGRIAIITDQLLSSRHSPTKLVLDYAKNIKKTNNDFEIKIFVEDNLISIKEEIIFPYYYSATPSIQCIEDHKNYLNDIDIDIFYSNTSQNKKIRTETIIKEIIKYNPEWVLTISDISLTTSVLYNLFPVVYFSMGENLYTSVADVYLHGNKKVSAEDNKRYNLINIDHVYEYKCGIEFPETTRKIRRSDYLLNTQDFVMVTVGNRLDAEMDEAYLNLICSFLEGRENVKWIIVGSCDLPYLREKFPIIYKQQIIKINYEKDIVSLYRICDIYLNPPRHGGGYSIAFAMNEGLPVVTFNEASDGLVYVGAENAVCYTFDDYLNEMNKLYSNREYRLEKSNVMKKQIAQFNMECAVKELLDIFKVAKESFLERKGST